MSSNLKTFGTSSAQRVFIGSQRGFKSRGTYHPWPDKGDAKAEGNIPSLLAGECQSQGKYCPWPSRGDGDAERNTARLDQNQCQDVTSVPAGSRTMMTDMLTINSFERVRPSPSFKDVDWIPARDD